MKTRHRSKAYPNDKNRYPVKEEEKKPESVTSLPLPLLPLLEPVGYNIPVPPVDDAARHERRDEMGQSRGCETEMR